MTNPVISAVEWAWRRQSVWSQTANKLKASPTRVWALRLSLTVAAAALALAGSQSKTVSLSASVALAVAAAVMLSAVGLLRGRQTLEQVRRWDEGKVSVRGAQV